MPSVASSTDDPQLQRRQQQGQAYIPRISYRHASSGDIPHVPAAPAQSAETGMPPVLRSQSDQTPCLRSNSIANPSASPRTPTKTAKTRGASFFGFLAVKEPSARALLDYEEHVRKQAPIHNGRLTAVGMPGVSSAKLPPTVPKVNSKWDGLPLAVREKEREKGGHRRHASFRANFSSITHGGSDHAQSSFSTLDSAASRRTAATDSSIFSSKRASQSSIGTRSGWEDGSISSGSDIKDPLCRSSSLSLRSHSSTTLGEITSGKPDGFANQMMPVATEDGALSGLDCFPPVPRLSESDSMRLAESATSIPTTSLPFTTAASRAAITLPTGNDDMPRPCSPTSPIARTDVSVKSSGADVLGPPKTVRTKAKLQPHSSRESTSTSSVQVEPSRSILKRETSRPESNSPARPPMSSYYTHPGNEHAGSR